MRRTALASAATLLCALCFLLASCEKERGQGAAGDSSEEAAVADEADPVFSLLGRESGLYKIFKDKPPVPLKTGASFSKIIRTPKSYFFVTDRGIMASDDLENFEERNTGLPSLTIKRYKDGQTSFEQESAQIKDLAVHPDNPDIMVTATKDCVFISYDGALSWKSLGSTNRYTAGVKAAAVCTLEGELVVFMSHPIYGFSYCLPESGKPAWNDCKAGFESMRTLPAPDEISDILCVSISDGETGEKRTEVFASQSFRPRIYSFDWNEKKARPIYSGEKPFETIDALFWDGGRIAFTRQGSVEALNPDSGGAVEIPDLFRQWKEALSALDFRDTPYCAYLSGSDGKEMALGELWLLKPQVNANKYYGKAGGAKAAYVSSDRIKSQKDIDGLKDFLRENRLTAVVIDLKDEKGFVTYDAKDSCIIEKGAVSKRPVNLEDFVSQMKAEGIYLVGRIVAFKDKKFSQYQGGKYAVWDNTTGRPWLGIRRYEDIKNEFTGEVVGQEAVYFPENWCDPYSPEVWEYNVAIGREAVSRGFDEIQYDYIRFPTDGLNLKNAVYRWKSAGMDKESALISFLKYSRENIDAPIGIDIYGSNGWYRSGAKTGQDVELLAKYVDVICPMFYPSHFEQAFLNYAPYEERPYRIYFFGSQRNAVIGRNRIIVRPWVQAFYIAVSYDKSYYGKDYVLREIYGVRDGAGAGYMYWSMTGDYGIISPDVGDSPYPWSGAR